MSAFHHSAKPGSSACQLGKSSVRVCADADMGHSAAAISVNVARKIRFIAILSVHLPSFSQLDEIIAIALAHRSSPRRRPGPKFGLVTTYQINLDPGLRRDDLSVRTHRVT